MPSPFPGKLDQRTSIRLARLEWQRARVLARTVINATYRSEYLAPRGRGPGPAIVRESFFEYLKRGDIDTLPQVERLSGVGNQRGREGCG